MKNRLFLDTLNAPVLTRPGMVPNKNPRQKNALLLCLGLGTLLLAGCGDPGPKALLKGDRLLQEKKFPEAISAFTTATQLLPQNARVWNHRGLAYHLSGQTKLAEQDYQHALSLDRDLDVARFNLGCLEYERGHYAVATEHFTTYVQFKRDSVEGWFRLGSSQLRHALTLNNGAERNRWLEAARKNLEHAQSLGYTLTAANSLAVVQAAQNRPTDALRSFQNILAKQPKAAAPLLNLAILSQATPVNRRFAVQKYREYLTQQPRSPLRPDIEAIIAGLELELNPPAVVTPPPAAVVTNTALPATNRVAVAASPAPVKAVTKETSPAVPVGVTPLPAKTNVIVTPKPTPAAPVVTAPLVVTKVEDEPPIRSAVAPAPVPTNPPAGGPASVTNVPVVVRPAANLRRYAYQVPAKPEAGQRAVAVPIYNQAVEWQQQGDLAKATDGFRRATQADPAFFEAWFKLGFIAFAGGDLPGSLRAYEYALAINPEAGSARYNFALALQKAGYPQDAANELGRVLEQNPKETRAHLTLANLSAQQLGDKAQARAHYIQVLALEPQHPEAMTIRYWLQANP